MDPNAALRSIRPIVTGLVDCPKSIHAKNDEPCGACERRAKRLAELFEGLDQWLTRGGALPDEWAKNRERGK